MNLEDPSEDRTVLFDSLFQRETSMMASRPRPDIAEITFHAYASRHQTNEEQRRCWRPRTRVTLMAIVSTVIASLIIYWFVNSILVSRNLGTAGRRDSKSRDQRRFSSEKQASYKRLSTRVVPLEYTLKIIPILEEGNFTILGYAEIQLYCYVPTRHVRLHARDLNIKDITLEEYGPGNAMRIVAKYVFELDDDFLDVFLLQLLNQGESYVLKIKYAASLKEEPRGLFRSKYKDDATGSSRWIAVSNFSPDFARRAFPCFDEPSIKTPFRISIGRTSNMRTHSNSIRLAVEKVYDMPGYVWDHYEKTPPMSTYLTAFMVTDFQSYQINVTDRPFHSVFARKDVLNDTLHVGYLMSRIVRLMQNLTGFHYEFNKLDAIVLPTLPYPAMENWGLVALREDVVKADKDALSINEERTLVEAVSREVAHQWFGHLVTPKWWSDIWLKEGLSSFFGIMALSMVNSTGSTQTALAALRRETFEREIAETAAPLHLNLTRKNNPNDILDSTVYAKGTCLVNMIYHFLGQSTFLSSIGRYVRSYCYRSADQDDLWDIFQEEIASTYILSDELLVRSIMNTWTHQAGFPVVHVVRDEKTGLVELTQERFYRLGLNGTSIASEELWTIPVSWTIESNQRFDETLPKAWMLQRRMVINDTGLSEAIFNNQWILFNINQTGLYRVNYDKENWRLLTSRFDRLPETTKLQLLDDAFAAFNAGSVEHDLLFDLLRRFDENTEESVWSLATESWRYIQYRLWDSEDFRLAMCELLDDVWSNDKIAARTIIESEMARMACSFGHKSFLNLTRPLVKNLLSRNSSTFRDVSSKKWLTRVYCTYVGTATLEEWRELRKKYETAIEPEKSSLAYALGCTPNVTSIKGYLSFLTDAIEDINSTITVPPSRYLGETLRSIADNPKTYEIAVDLLERMDKTSTTKSAIKDEEQLIHILRGFSYTMSQEENVKWLTRFKAEHESEYESTAIESIINDVKFNVAWNRRHRNAMLETFKKVASNLSGSNRCSRN